MRQPSRPADGRGGGTGNYGRRCRSPVASCSTWRAGSCRVAFFPGRVASRPGEAARHRQGPQRSRRRDRGRWELRFHPSTRKQATIGGFIAGGAAGCGSCTWGQIADPGAVLAVEVATVEETPRLIELTGHDILKVLHAYGVNGIITEVDVPLAPWHPWAERVAVFPTLAEAARFAWRSPRRKASPRRRSASSTGASRRC